MPNVSFVFTEGNPEIAFLPYGFYAYGQIIYFSEYIVQSPSYYVSDSICGTPLSPMLYQYSLLVMTIVYNNKGRWLMGVNYSLPILFANFLTYLGNAQHVYAISSCSLFRYQCDEWIRPIFPIKCKAVL